MSEVSQGVTKWFNTTKGYGFFQVEGYDKDIFVHAQELRKSGILRPLVEGEAANFVIAESPKGKGKYATQIKLLKG